MTMCMFSVQSHACHLRARNPLVRSPLRSRRAFTAHVSWARAASPGRWGSKLR